MLARDQMPRGQKDPSGLCGFIAKYADRALYLSGVIADYSSRYNREQRLREFHLTVNHIKELLVTAHERGYLPKRATLNCLSAKLVVLAEQSASYARALEKKRRAAQPLDAS